MKKGEIYWVNLDPTNGSEISKTRPAIIVSNDVNNVYSDTVTILPITSNTEKIYPYEVLLTKGEANLVNASKAKANQIRTIDKQRIGKKIGKVSNSVIMEIENAILVHLAIKQDNSKESKNIKKLVKGAK